MALRRSGRVPLDSALHTEADACIPGRAVAAAPVGAKADPEPDSDTAPHIRRDACGKSDPEPDSEPGTATGSESVPDSDPESDAKTNPDAKTDTGYAVQCEIR